MLVKPIALYACDVWGGFNVKRNAKYDSLYKQLLENDNTPYEHLNIKVSKHSLQQGNQRWQTSPAAPPGGLGHSPTF